MKKIVVTGGSGQIAYSLLFRIASGELFGKDVPICLNILEIPETTDFLKGVVMELEDCCFPLLKKIQIGSDPYALFSEVDLAILIGAKPRSKGMERKDLLAENGKIFVQQGKALNEVAHKKTLVFVVGNPCNTNCLIALHHAPNLDTSQFYAMTRLDQNRAQFQLAKRANTSLQEISHVTIWGNHSATQVPDFINAKINKTPLLDVINDRKWLETTFFETVQKRGSSVIQARGKSSAASAANAILDGIHSIISPTKNGWHSTSIYSKENPYHIDNDLIFSFPCITKEEGKIEIVKSLIWDDFLQKKIQETENELKEERSLIKHLL